MSLISLNDGWMRFGQGRPWRCAGPLYLCEVDSEGNAPDFLKAVSDVAKIRKIRAFYAGRLSLGTLDANSYGLDVMIANTMTESFGSVPTPFSYTELNNVYSKSELNDMGSSLDSIITYVKIRQKNIVRREPSYVNPLVTPNKLSVGAHQMLISTALDFYVNPQLKKEDKIKELCIKLASDSLFTADLAIKYFNRYFQRHRNQPPLLAATYNAGSPRATSANPWGLVQYGAHIDRWVGYFNTSRKIAKQQTQSVISASVVNTIKST